MADQEPDLRRRATILKEIEDREKAIAQAIKRARQLALISPIKKEVN